MWTTGTLASLALGPQDILVKGSARVQGDPQKAGPGWVDALSRCISILCMEGIFSNQVQSTLLLEGVSSITWK